MVSDVNPYRPPTPRGQRPQANDDAHEVRARIARGKAVFFVLLVLVSLLEGGLGLMGGHGSLVVRAALTIAVWYAMWRGQEWAIALAAVLYALGAIITLAYGIGSGHLFGFALGGLYATGYVVVLVSLFTSKSLNEFFRYQRGALDGTGTAPPTQETRAARGEPHSAEQELVGIYDAGTEAEAHQLKNLLAEAGINAEVTDTGLAGVTGTRSAGWLGVAQVVVNEDDAEVARRIALGFDERISDAAKAPEEEPAAAEAAAEVPGAWPRCPQCGALRTTRCPACGASGTHFAPADPDFTGPPVVDGDAQPISCSCGPGVCSPPQSASETNEADAGAGQIDGQGPGEPAPWMLLCPECDESFVPEYARNCRQCGHEFADGYDFEGDTRDRITLRAILLMCAVGAVVIGLLVYFASIL